MKHILAIGMLTAFCDLAGATTLTPSSIPQMSYQYVPDNSTTAVLLGMGLLGLVAFRRKFALS